MAAIIIGDEILTGKVRDVNAALVVKRLRDLGTRLWRLSFIGDDPDDIADEVGRCASRCDAVITSGGVGPTHDDRTMAGVARAFGVGLVRDPEIAATIRSHWGDRISEAALVMADVPEGSRLLADDDGLLPIVAFRNVYMLPGIPRLFEAKLEILARELAGRRTTLQSLYLSCDESSIAPILAAVDQEHAGVSIGSYPRFGEKDHRLWITVEGDDPRMVEQATQALLERLPAASLVRVDRGGPAQE